MLVRGRAQRDKMSQLLDEWADWVFHENRGELRQLGIKSWLGELVKNNNTDKNTYHEPIPTIDLSTQDERMVLVDNAVRSLPSLQRQTIMVEYVVRRKDRVQVRENWLRNSGRTLNAHRKMLSSVKDLLWLGLSINLDKEE